MKALAGRAKALRPQDVVASFDSASVLHAGLVAALTGRPFPHLGNPPAAAAAVRVAGRLPWPILRHLYTRVGAAEGVDPARLSEVDMDDVAAWLADGIPERRYPAALIGSSNGALTHLAAAISAGPRGPVSQSAAEQPHRRIVRWSGLRSGRWVGK